MRDYRRAAYPSINIQVLTRRRRHPCAEYLNPPSIPCGRKSSNRNERTRELRRLRGRRSSISEDGYRPARSALRLNVSGLASPTLIGSLCHFRPPPLHSARKVPANRGWLALCASLDRAEPHRACVLRSDRSGLPDRFATAARTSFSPCPPLLPPFRALPVPPR